MTHKEARHQLSSPRPLPIRASISLDLALRLLRVVMSDVWYARQLAKQAVAAGCHADTIRKHMMGRSGAITRRG